MADSADSPDADRTRVGEGRLPVSEFAAEVQGGLSPFGEDVQFPLPPEKLRYQHPGPEDRPQLVADAVE